VGDVSSIFLGDRDAGFEVRNELRRLTTRTSEKPSDLWLQDW
jgi:hypothetical protein